MHGLVGDASVEFERLRQESRDLLAARGLICAGSGSLSWSTGRLLVHSDFGPSSQDKHTNQDFVLAWVRPDDDESGGVRWGIAMADGVSSSWFAEYGAEIACWAALASLLSAASACGRAVGAINAAGNAVGLIGDTIIGAPEASLPRGELLSTWRFAMRKGLLLQTTLSLAWHEGDVIHLAFIGDGGAVIDQIVGDVRETNVVNAVEQESHRVHALGPLNRQVEQPDMHRQVAVEGTTRLGVFTDGIGRGLLPKPESLFTEADEFASEELNVAEELIARWISQRGEAFDDNLTLGIVTETKGNETRGDT